MKNWLNFNNSQPLSSLSHTHTKGETSLGKEKKQKTKIKTMDLWNQSTSPTPAWTFQIFKEKKKFSGF